MSRPTMSTPRSDSAAIRENLADIRAKLSFHIDGTSSSSMGGNNNESHNNSTSVGGMGIGGGSSATSRFRQRPLFTFGNSVPLSSAVHRDPLSSGNGTPRRGMSFSERPQTPTGRSPSTQASAQYLLSTQRELERVQRDKHEWERRCMELEASNAELTDELQYIQECMSNKQQQQQQGSGGAYERVASEEELSITSRSNTGNGGGVSPSPRADTVASASTTLPGATSPQANSVDGAAAARIEALLSEIKTISNERDTLLQQHQATGAQLGVLMDEYEKEKAAKDLRVAAMQKEVDEANQSCGKALRAAEQLQARHTSEIAELEADLQDAHNEVEKLALAAKTTTSVDSAIYEQSKKELESANAFSAQQHEELEHIRSQLAISEKMQTELSNDQKSLLGQLDVAKKLIEELSGKNKSLEDSYSVILDGGKTTQEELTIEINELKAEAAESQSTIAYLEESYASEKEARENAEITIEELKEEVAAATEKATIAATTAATAAIAQRNGDFDSSSSSSDGEDDDDEEMPAIDFEDLTRQLAKMTEAIEAVGGEKSTIPAAPIDNANVADTTVVSAALQAAEAAQQRLHRSSHDSQVELQAAIEDCARNLQERQRSHLDMHKENLRSREVKKKEWLARKIEDVEAAYEAKIGGLESMIAELQKELNANDNDLVDVDELVKANADRQRLNLVLKGQEEEINSQQHQIEILRNTLAEHTTAAAAASHQDTSSSAAKEEELLQELSTLQTTLENQRGAYKALEDERSSLEQRLSEEDAERTMNSTNRDAALMSRLNDLTAEYEVVVAERDEYLVKINGLEAEVKETSSALETANDKLLEVSSKKEEEASVTASPPPSTATTAWPSKSIVFGAETKDQIPAKTLNDVLESGCDFTPFGFAHIYDHTCWAFDAFNLDSTGPYAPQLLMHVSTSIYRDIIDPEWSLGSPEELSELAVSMGLPTTDQFLHFVANVFNGYHGRDVCPYHSRTHAADIVQMSVMLAKNSLLPPDIKMGDDQDDEEEHALLYLWDVMSSLERFSLLIAALTHDCSHPGKNNGFHNRTRDPLAIRYNGKSVLENHHATTTFTLCQDPALDITAHMTDGQRAEFYNGVTYMILGTDMALHNQHLEEFMNKAVVPLFTKAEEEDGDNVAPPVVAVFNEATNADDRLLAMRTILHAADIGNSARPFHIARKWAVAVRDEFFAQGKAEKSMGLTPSMGCDEEIDAKAGGIGPSQIGFIDFMILPLWHVLVKRYGLEAPGREALLEVYNEEADTIFDNQQTILDDVLESSMNPFRGEDVIIEFGEEITDEVEAFAWRTHFGLQMMVDALQANRLMWLDITPKEHQKRFSLEAPDDKSEIAITAAIKKMKAAASAAVVKPALSSSSTVPCEECVTKQNALAEMQKALEEGQRDVNALLANKVVLIKELSETQQDLESAVEAARKKAVEMMAAGGGGSSSPRGGGAGQEEQHQARVKQLKEMIMTANQKKSELEADNKELKRRIVELENNNITSTPIGKATAAVASSRPSSSVPKAVPPPTSSSSPTSPPRGDGVGSRPTSRYGMRGGETSSSSSSSGSSDGGGKDGF